MKGFYKMSKLCALEHSPNHCANPLSVSRLDELNNRDLMKISEHILNILNNNDKLDYSIYLKTRAYYLGLNVDELFKKMVENDEGMKMFKYIVVCARAFVQGYNHENFLVEDFVRCQLRDNLRDAFIQYDSFIKNNDSCA